MDLQKKRKLAAAILLGILCLAGIQQIQHEEEPLTVVSQNAAETPENSFSQPEMQKQEIVIHVAGAAKNPGVYTLPEGARVEDALKKAGIAEHADADALNRAAILSDGQKIVVPFATDAHTINQQDISTESIPQTSEQNAKINLNQAGFAELITLPGIGEVKANAIIRYRQEHGNFQSIDELLFVNGIGDGIYAQIAELVCV